MELEQQQDSQTTEAQDCDNARRDNAGWDPYLVWRTRVREPQRRLTADHQAHGPQATEAAPGLAADLSSAPVPIPK